MRCGRVLDEGAAWFVRAHGRSLSALVVPVVGAAGSGDAGRPFSLRVWWCGGLDVGGEPGQEAVEVGHVGRVPRREGAGQRVAAAGEGGVQLGPALGGEVDALRAAVVGVLAALHEADPFELADVARGGGGVELHAARELGDPERPAVEVLEHPVGRGLELVAHDALAHQATDAHGRVEDRVDDVARRLGVGARGRRIRLHGASIRSGAWVMQTNRRSRRRRLIRGTLDFWPRPSGMESRVLHFGHEH